MSFVDAICVKILDNDRILYGKGNRLVLLCAGSKRVINSTTTYDKIHKISFVKINDSDYFVSCSAGRELLVTTVSDNAFISSSLVRLCDWISSVLVLNDLSIAIITAHNLAALITMKNNKAVIEDSLRCDENSTLYCSNIFGSSWDDLTFFSATALGELIVWKKVNGCSQIIHRKFLHNGVIFSIDYNKHYLVSSSDDRSIKVFDVKSSNESFELAETMQLFGHTSRVFVCRIIEFNSCTHFLSAGEDSNLCVWSEKGDLLSKKNISASGVLWNLDYDASTQIILTSSSTGKLNKFKLHEILYEKRTRESLNSTENCQPTKLKYLKCGALIVIDNMMQLHVKSPSQSEWTQVQHLTKNVVKEKFVAMEVWENRLFLAAKSSIIVFDFTQDSLKLKFTCEIWINQLLSTSPPSTSLDYLRTIHPISANVVVICDKIGACFVLDVTTRKILNHFLIPQSSEPWTTSVAQLDEFWLIGDRVGNFFLFENGNDSSKALLPVQKLRKLHGKLGVTTISDVQAEGFIKTTGNDGTVKTLYIDRKTSPPTMEVHRTERNPLNWIEKVCSFNGLELLLGFNDNFFAICHNRQIIYEHNCGGRHRHWDLDVSDDKRVIFTYIQKKELKSVEFLLSDFNQQIDDVNWHTKDCNVIELFDDNLLISGGEDTLLKLTRINIIDGEATTTFKEIATVNSHISSVKTIATVKVDEDLLIFSAGGRAQIVVTRLVKMKHVKEEVNFMLTSGKSRKSNFDPETRITSICYDSGLRNLFVACSDGFVRIFSFHQNVETSFELTMIVEQFYGKCILKIALVEHFILTMATDGFICFWHLLDDGSTTKSLRLIDKLKHNQSGINCFDVYNCGGGVFSIGTSGDDGAVYITEFSIDGSNVFFQETISSHEIHIAQVTGLKFMSRTVFCTTSIDQTVAMLEIVNSEAINVLRRKFTCISDVKGFLNMNMHDDKHIVVYGAGLEVLNDF